MPDRPLGYKQLDLLSALGSPSMTLLTGDADRLAVSLSRRGLLQRGPNNAGWRITPAGLRRLADELEAGRLDEWIER